MTSTNLTQAEATQRAELISAVHYSIDLDVQAAADSTTTTFGSSTSIRFTSRAGSTFLDAQFPQVDRVLLDGVDITPSSFDATAGIPLPNLTAGSHEVIVEGRGAYSTTGEGLHRFFDPADGRVYMYTQFETSDAKRVFACFDQPDIKATYELRILTPAEFSVISNSSVAHQPAPNSTAGEGNLSHKLSVDYPLSTYLIALCIGPWYCVHNQWTGTITPHPETNEAATAQARQRGPLITEGTMQVPLGLYCRQSLAEYLDPEELFTITQQGFDYYAQHFGIGYPFGKYDQVFCPEYNMGAMENAGCVTIRDEYIFRSAASHYQYERRAETILHELAHMWFGDLVTMQWWDDLWLNESFATWSAAMSQAGATRYTTAWVTFANKEKAWAYAQDQLSSTHPVFSDAQDIATVSSNFDGITYAKGASVLKQLAAYVGSEAFFAGIRAHFAAHAWANATFDDLLSALEKSSGRDLSGWADQWLKTTGINTLAAEFSTNSSGYYDAFTLTQQGAQPGAGETRTHRVGVGIYAKDGSGQVQRTAHVEVDITGESTHIPELVGVRAGELVVVNDDDLTYALSELDPDSLHTAQRSMNAIADPMARSLLWSATWQMTRSARMRTRDFIPLVALGIPAETELAVLEQLLAQARMAVDNYADPQWAEDKGWAMLHSSFLKGMSSTTGSAQLAFARGFAGLVHVEQTASILRILLGETSQSSEDIAPGLRVDQDLRWQLIIALAAAQRVSGESEQHVEARILAEERKDSSSAGAMFALQARAALPNAGTKEKVWEELITKAPTLTNLHLRATIAGFTHSGHADLLAHYGLLYAAEAVSLWNSLTPEMALRTLSSLYPTWDHSAATHAAITQLIDLPTTPAGLRRTLKEGRDATDRARRARAFDAASQPL